MVHYIRFLSPPQVTETQKKTLTISAVVAVTTDLGDAYFPEDLALIFQVVGTTKVVEILHEQVCTWVGGSRALKISLQCPGKYTSRSVRLHVTSQNADPSSRIHKILDVWTLPFELTDKQRAEPLVDREIRLSNKKKLKIREETGDSIARHVWDASLGFLIFLDQISEISSESTIANLLSTPQPKRLRTLELGAGCGLVGIAFAQLVKCDMILTDLNDAMDILQKNLAMASLKSGSTLRADILDWSSELHSSLNVTYDLALVSDCIYNPDSSVHLVETLLRLAETSPNILILVGFKRRHEADDTFFNCMKMANFRVLEIATISLPHTPSEYDASPPAIEFYTYQLPT